MMNESFQRKWGDKIASDLEAIAKSCSFCSLHEFKCLYPNCKRTILEERFTTSIWGKKAMIDEAKL